MILFCQSITLDFFYQQVYHAPEVLEGRLMPLYLAPYDAKASEYKGENKEVL
jgi:hypothetical protein